MTADPRPPSPADQHLNLYEMATAQFHRAADAIELDADVRTILCQPKNEIIVNFPVRMDDGAIRLFKGYRIQHNNILGPYKGGIRFHHQVDLEEVKALAAWMTWKSSLAGLPYGGAKGGVNVRPNQLSKDELMRLTRRFTHALGTNIGPEYDIPAPDVGTNSQTMDWMMDTYVNTVSTVDRTRGRAVVTGKSLACGGSQGREKATGQGVCLHHRAVGQGPRASRSQDLRVAVQGFGNVGYWTCAIIVRDGREGRRRPRPHGRDHERPRHRRRRAAAPRRRDEPARRLHAAARKSRPRPSGASDCDVMVPGGDREPDHGEDRARSSAPRSSSRARTARRPRSPSASSCAAASRSSPTSSRTRAA